MSHRDDVFAVRTTSLKIGEDIFSGCLRGAKWVAIDTKKSIHDSSCLRFGGYPIDSSLKNFHSSDGCIPGYHKAIVENGVISHSQPIEAYNIKFPYVHRKSTGQCFLKTADNSKKYPFFKMSSVSKWVTPFKKELLKKGWFWYPRWKPLNIRDPDVVNRINQGKREASEKQMRRGKGSWWGGFQSFHETW